LGYFFWENMIEFGIPEDVLADLVGKATVEVVDPKHPKTPMVARVNGYSTSPDSDELAVILRNLTHDDPEQRVSLRELLEGEGEDGSKYGGFREGLELIGLQLQISNTKHPLNEVLFQPPYVGNEPKHQSPRPYRSLRSL
jgi:hypothetical protein